jgi:hypothetical protein
MKKQYAIHLLLLFLVVNGLMAQPGPGNSGAIPYKLGGSPLFGKDIVINDQPAQDQRTVSLCTASNGWNYSVTTYYDSIQHISNFDILRSTDGGMTWNIIYPGLGTGAGDVKLKVNDIVAIDQTSSDIKLFWAYKYSTNTSPWGGSFVLRFNGNTGDFEAILPPWNPYVSDIKIISDYFYSSVNSNPHSFGILYSLHATDRDSLIFLSSDDAGMTVTHKQVLAVVLTSHFRKISLNYGRSASYPEGRYFATWEVVDDMAQPAGHIYTSHSEPYFNSPFTTPICLDSLDSSSINKLRNPTIACQYSSTDNSEGNLSEIIICEKYVPDNNSFEIQGFYNKKAVGTNNFTPFSPASSSNYRIQPSVNFNPYNSTFMLTYFDSTELKLPFLTNDVNLTNPDLWDVTSSAYNDNPSLINPKPTVKINDAKQAGMNAWISEGPGNSGVALFDAAYSDWTGINEGTINATYRAIKIYPNPCHDMLNLVVELNDNESVKIEITNSMGKNELIFPSKTFSKGKHKIMLSVSSLSEGPYFYKFITGAFSTSGKFIIIR